MFDFVGYAIGVLFLGLLGLFRVPFKFIVSVFCAADDYGARKFVAMTVLTMISWLAFTFCAIFMLGATAKFYINSFTEGRTYLENSSTEEFQEPLDITDELPSLNDVH